jgi:hypothetical protein
LIPEEIKIICDLDGGVWSGEARDLLLMASYLDWNYLDF